MYQVGDKVSYSFKNLKATVIKLLPYDEYRIEFDDKSLIPPQMDVLSFTLSPWEVGQDEISIFGWDDFKSRGAGNKETNCPRCGTKWTETLIGHEKFYDCIKCNLKKEDA